MNALILVIIALFGLTIGSFLNVLILRKSVKKSLFGRSSCRGCKKHLSPIELIPVISFLIQKGRCRTCGIALSWQYPIVEFTTAALFIIVFVLFLPQFAFDARSLGIFTLLGIGVSAAVVAFVYDLRYTIIPDYTVIILFLLGIVATAVRSDIIITPIAFQNSFIIDWIAALLISGFFTSLWFFSRGTWMGLGDAKLILATSLILGFPASLIAFIFAFWLGAAVSIALMVFAKAGVKSLIPFGPFIIIASIIAYFLTPFITCIDYPIMCLLI
ncbi:MAG: prepilin peptidase [Candidatus Sungbacteria bacterium]|nr:prepilin peptidase [Candidatus Sungbacteria bacterium]